MTRKAMTLPAVLVVEDEPLIRMEAVDMIEDAGFKVYEASNADAAMKLMRMHDDIGILFTDIDMPGSMDGIELAKYVNEHWPSVAIVIASGKVDVILLQLPKGSTIFPKPYPTDRVTKTLSDIVKKVA